MLVNAINMQPIRGMYNNSKNCTPNFSGLSNNCPEQNDTFGAWATKNVATAATFSLAWDAGTNVLSKFSKNVDAIPVGKMCSNVARVAGVFLLIGGIFRAVSKVVDKK